jgi:uncharacterized iron-regulated membrane protein
VVYRRPYFLHAMTFKQIIGKIHLIMGLFSGAVVLIVALTGAGLVFEHEIESLFPEGSHVNDRAIEVQQATLLKPSQIKALFELRHPGLPVSGVNYRKGYASMTWAWKDGADGYDISMLVNPYTGEVIQRQQKAEEHARAVDKFFDFVLTGHLHLWLPDEIGKTVVDYATLIFLAMMISGIILWWPKNKPARKQRFRFQWKPTTKWRRKNYDLHNVLGFYMTWIAIFLTITGLVMAFDWFAKGWYFTLSGGEQVEFHKPADYIPIRGDHVDILWERFFNQYPDFNGWIEFYYPETADEGIMYRCDPYPGRREAEDRVFNPYTLEEQGKESPLAYAVLDANYAIHVGEIGGLPTKVLAFFASLIAASLPVTGIFIWWGRRNKASGRWAEGHI